MTDVVRIVFETHSLTVDNWRLRETDNGELLAPTPRAIVGTAA